MTMTVLRRLGGWVALVVPPAILELLNWRVGEKIGLVMSGNKLTQQAVRPRYSLEELLMQCDPVKDVAHHPDPEWLEDDPRGRELL